MKVCKVCGVLKSVDIEFHKDHRSGKAVATCKSCTREKDRLRSLFNPARRAGKNRSYRYHTDGGKTYARRILQNAVKYGKIEKKPCVVCGDHNSQGHHEDYLKPLDVVWYCRKHHLERHVEMAVVRQTE